MRHVCGVAMDAGLEEVVEHVGHGEPVLVETADGRRFIAVPVPDDDLQEEFDGTLDARIAAAEDDVRAGRVTIGDADTLIRAIASDE